MKKNILSILLILILPFTTKGQENDTTSNKSLVITRDYKPVFENSSKVFSIPKQAEFVVKKRKPRYSDLTVPIVNKYNIHTLKAKELKHNLPSQSKGFVQLGAGNPLNTMANVFYPIYNDDNDHLNTTFKHFGSFRNRLHSETKLFLDYKHQFTNSEFYFQANGQHNYFNYYGSMFEGDKIISNTNPTTTTLDTYTTPENRTVFFNDIYNKKPTDNHFRINTQIGLRSLNPSKSFVYDALLSYHLFQSEVNEVVEHQSHFKGLLEKISEKNDNSIGGDLEVFNFIYEKNNTHFEQLNKADYTLIKASPFYKIIGRNIWLKLGVKAGIILNEEVKVKPTPDIHFKWNAIPKYISLYGGLTGDVEVNSLSKIYNENRYLSAQNRVKDTYIPLDAYFGVKFSPKNNLIFDVYTHHKIIENPYFYVNREYQNNNGNQNIYSNKFDVVYTQNSVQKTTIGGHISWKYFDKASFYFKGAYNNWILDNSQAYAWHLPNWESDCGASFSVSNKLKINTQFIFQDGRYSLLNGKTTTLESIVDWNVGLSYKYFNWVSFFAKANNILNKSYPIFNGYNSQKFNTLFGVSFSL